MNVDLCFGFNFYLKASLDGAYSKWTGTP